MKNPIVELSFHAAIGDLEPALVVIYRDGKRVRLTGAEAEAKIKKALSAVGEVKEKVKSRRDLIPPKYRRLAPKK